MVCHKCGHELTGKENFCSFCGEKVEAKKVVDQLAQEEKVDFSFSEPKESKPFVKPQMPEMNWNVAEFNPQANKKEDPVIFWRTEDMFMGKELKETRNKIDFTKETSQADEVKENLDDKEAEKVDFEVPPIFNKKKEENKPSFLVDSGLFYEEEDLSESKPADDDFTKEYKPLDSSYIDENEDEYAEEKSWDEKESQEEIVEVEQPNGIIEVELVGEDKKEVAVNYQPEMTRVILDEEELENLENIIREAKKKEEGEDLSVSLFDEIAEEVVDTLENSKIDEEKKRIDKFYTFNRKKEEFQQLLDKEYERIEKNVESGGLEKDVEGFIDVEIGREVEGTSQLEEMVKAREIFFDTPQEIEEEAKEDVEEISEEDIENYHLDDETSSDVKEEVQEENLSVDEQDEIKEEDITLDSVEEAKKEAVLKEIDKADEIQKPEFLEDKKNEFVQVPYDDVKEDSNSEEKLPEDANLEGMKLDIGENGDSSRVIIEPKKNTQLDVEEKEKIEEEFFKETEEKQKSRGAKLVIRILIAIVILIAGLFTIRVAMPTSYIAQYIDEISNKVVSVFKSDSQKNETQQTKEVKKEDVKEKEQNPESEKVVEKSVTTETNEQ